MIRQSLRNLKDQLGWQGICGIALLFLAGVFHWLVIAPLEQQTSLMQGRVDAAHAKAAHAGARTGKDDLLKDLGAFYRALPEEKDITDIMGAIYATAEAYGVKLKDASYRLEDKEKPRIEYVMDFPMIGEYKRIRLFVTHILARYPYIALDQIDFKREKISEATLKVNVRMTIFLRPPG